ncbi:hypothetical protein [Sphingobium lactosutens]|uniref:hypothetical protein n=1 Tax=Sphingobium lactosutens TaxID=522773 RepID=UPI0015BEED93|nr:hypothetical protein [Sphingobium lactosutens]
MLLFLSSRLFLGVAIDGKRLITYAGGRIHHWREPAPAVRTMYLRIENREHIITFYYSVDGKTWTRHGLRMESSGYNANTIMPGEGEKRATCHIQQRRRRDLLPRLSLLGLVRVIGAYRFVRSFRIDTNNMPCGDVRGA